MSERIVVEFDQVGKMYRLYRSRLQSLLDITSLGHLMPRWQSRVDNFWAIRNVSLELKAGSRLGIIGRNGAGKTTLLKLMTGNVMPTEGSITVRGEVRALLEAGAGFHPEFSGYENIAASLIQNGFTRSQIKAAVDEIADFTELGDFLRQPFKTYSAGMQARLVFTTATVVHPDILIIDEILGAGDAYFAVKSRSRMRELVESGASILLVSHALDQILQFCDEAIWLERGRIVLRGPSMEVVKAYEEFVHKLEDQRLKAANRQRKLGFRDGVEIGQFADNMVVALSLSGCEGARADVSVVEFRCEDIAQEILRVGDTQDSDQGYLCSVALTNSQWSDPQIQQGVGFRSLAATADGNGRSLGEMVFRAYVLEPGRRYSFRIVYRMFGEARLSVTVSHNGQAVIADMPLLGAEVGWQSQDLVLPSDCQEFDDAWASTENRARDASDDESELMAEEPTPPLAINGSSHEHETERLLGELSISPGSGSPRSGAIARAASVEERSDVVLADGDTQGSAAAAVEPAISGPNNRRVTLRRWPGEGSLLIEDVTLHDVDGKERAVFRVGAPLTLRLQYRAVKKGFFPIVHAIAIYTIDGIKVTQHVSAPEVVTLDAGERRGVRLEFASLDLANNRYVISISLHRELDPYQPGETVRYDLLDRSYEFEVIGNPPLRTSLFVLPARWASAAEAPPTSG